MTNLNELLAQSIPATLPQTLDTYENPADGLLYCPYCHTPKQAKISFPGKEMVVNVLCHCQKQRRDQEIAARKRRELMDFVTGMRANSLQNANLKEYTFEHDLGYTAELTLAKRYVAQWDSMKAQNMGLLLWGSVGTGKSFFAGCIANALLAQGVPVLMTNFAKILGAVTGMYGMERQRFLSSLNTYSLLILDDLGAERNSEYALEQLFGVVDSRYQSRKPMIVTTNLTLEELKHPSDLAHERIYDRLLERCVPVKMNGKNIRNVHAKELLHTGKHVLCGEV